MWMETSRTGQTCCKKCCRRSARRRRGDAARLAHLATFVVSAHRGGRGLRPENTLPSFEDGLDHLATELETDTGVSTDHVSLIWHDQFYNPGSCRRADGSAYTMENRVYLRDLSSADAQKTFICDKLHQGPAYGTAQFPDQTNDLSLSPVSVAFAKKEGMINPYAPTYVAQLFRFVAFYAEYYAKGPGRTQMDAAARAANARTVRFNLETKILPELPASMTAKAKDPSESLVNHTVGPQLFVDTLCGVIEKYHMVSRADVQSFDFRTPAVGGGAASGDSYLLPDRAASDAEQSNGAGVAAAEVKKAGGSICADACSGKCAKPFTRAQQRGIKVAACEPIFPNRI